MLSTSFRRPGLARMAPAFLVCAALVHLQAQGATTIVVWKVGSPHTGNTPDPTPPRGLSAAARQLGGHLAVRSFPADGFAEIFAESVARNQPPDILAVDNFGIIEGITTSRGTFTGVAADPAVKRSLLRATGAFDELLAPERGWTYLLTSSPNHDAARRLALGAPSCEGFGQVALADGLEAIVGRVARAYLARNLSSLHVDADPERLVTTRPDDRAVTVGAVTACAAWGNARLAFVRVGATYATDTETGHAQVLLVLRKPVSRWQWLVATRDPVSTGGSSASFRILSACWFPAVVLACCRPPPFCSHPPTASIPAPFAASGSARLPGSRARQRRWLPRLPSSHIATTRG
jgi:hypothetical protein